MSLFTENMTREEAWDVLFSSVDGKTKEEREEIMSEYEKVLPVIVQKELKGPYALTSYQVT